MKNCKVDCGALDNNEIDVDFNFKLWPCCIYQNQFAEFGKTGDPYIDSLPKDWNDLKRYTFDEITSNKVFTEYLTEESWNDSKKCSPVCWEYCKNDDYETGRNILKISEKGNK